MKTVINPKTSNIKTCNAHGQITDYLQGTNLVTQKNNDPYGFQTFTITFTENRINAYKNYNFDVINGDPLSLPDNMTRKTRYFDYSHFNCLTHEMISKIARISNVFTKQ
jgi:hypothetical protein